ncbi:MAG: FadR family transcriptional regulator [Acidobacteria bacterium]|nr:FadR family transcriptional regulator [Acidobacteriota bacterium]
MFDEPSDWAGIYQSQLSVPDNLAVELERLILCGQLPVGGRIPPERELAELWGLSRSSVRDALKQLELRGLIERRPGRGTIVVDNVNQLGGTLVELLNEGQHELLQVMEVRAVIEPWVAARAAQRARPLELEEIGRLLHEMSDKVSDQRLAELDRAFHLAIARAAGNPLLASLLERVGEIVAESPHELLQNRREHLATLSEHAAIFQALCDKDVGAAEAAAQSHLDSIERQILSGVSRVGSSKTTV